MATVGVSPYANAGAVNAGNANSSPTVASDPLANESTFLQLLVAQLKNQNPAQPLDGTTFVTQLAQFSDLEQNLAMRQDLDAMSQKYLGTDTPSSKSQSTGQTQDSSTSKTNS